MTTYYITICAHSQQNLFQPDEVAKLMLATFFKYRDAGEFDLHEYVVMPNHIHLLLSINDAQKLGRVIQLIKGGFSHSLRDSGIVFRAVWEQRYYDRRIREENEFAEFARYIRHNPVRKGLVERAEECPFSSAGRGLKPLEINKGMLHTNLKVRSACPSEIRDARLKETFKRVLVVTVLLAAAQATAAQDSSGCTTLYHHGNRDIVLCYVTVGETERYTRTYLTNTSTSEEAISRETYMGLMETDMKEEAEHTAQVAAADKKFADDMKAIADDATRRRKAAEQIRNKKECKTAGFIWLNGTWAAPGVCYAN